MLTIVKKERIAFILTFCVTAGIALLDRFTDLHVNNNVVLFIVHYIALCTLFLMISQYLFGELSKKIILLLFALLFSTCFGMAMLTWKSNWKTQTVIYRHVKCNNETIEYQMRSSHQGCFYDRQIVHRKRIIPYLDYIRRIDTSKINRSKWIKVDEKRNEMEFPGEYIDAPCD